MKRLVTSFLIMVLAGMLVTANAQKTKFKTLKYLYSISGSKTIAGIHNREPNVTPARWTNEVEKATGKFPGLWSGDFLFQKDNIKNRRLMVDEALAQWEKGAVVNIMWHACNPAMDEPCGWRGGVMSKLTDEQWKELTTEDVYDDKSGYTREKYNLIVSVSNGKPIAIGECQKLPTSGQLLEQPRWTFFMGWSELEFSKNTVDQIKDLHHAPYVITLDQMPGWNRK